MYPFIFVETDTYYRIKGYKDCLVPAKRTAQVKPVLFFLLALLTVYLPPHHLRHEDLP